MKKNKNKNIFLYIILFLLIITAIGLGVYYYYDKTNTKKLVPVVKDLVKEKEQKQYSDKDDNKKNIEEYINELPNYRNQYNNQNIMGRLEIPNLNINALVTRSSNNEYYLNNNLYNQHDGLGVPFFDYRNTDLNNNKQINIYGHNTMNEKYMSQLPFINLEAYVDENIFKNYKDIYLSIDERQIHYEVIAVKVINGSNPEHMKVIFYSDQDYLNHVSKLLSDTMYKESNIEINALDRLIVLQVCHYNPPNTYLLVIGKEVK